MSDDKENGMMFRNRRLKGISFERFAEDYANVRPGYPDAAIRMVVQSTNMSRQSHVLEIGVGTGIATKELLKTGARIIGIEPGVNLISIARDSMKGQDGVELHEQAFEDFHTDQRFDVVFSATAFHWLKGADKFERIAHLLNPGGFLVVMWNSFCKNDDPVDQEIDRCYQQHLPAQYDASGNVNQQVLAKAMGKVAEILDSEIFYLASMDQCLTAYTYSADRYVALLKTFPKIIETPDDVRDLFLAAVHDVITRHQHVIVPVLTSVCICRKAADFTQRMRAR